MSKITSDRLTQFGTGCFIVVLYLYDNSGRQRVKVDDCFPLRSCSSLYLCLPYILAYKSPPKNRVRMLSKIIDPRISRRWLLRPCTGCKLPSTEAYTKIVCTAAIYSVVEMSDWRQGRPLAARWGRRAVASAWPLMRNWDHGRSKLQWTTGKMWESVVSEKNAWHCCRRPTCQWWQVRQSSC